MKISRKQYAAIRRSTLSALRQVLDDKEASLLQVYGDDGEVTLAVLCAQGPLAGAMVRAVRQSMGDPASDDRWEVLG